MIINNSNKFEHTEVVVDEIGGERRLFVFPASVQAGAGIRGVGGEHVRADPHELSFAQELSHGRGAGGERTRELLSRHPRLRTCIP